MVTVRFPVRRRIVVGAVATAIAILSGSAITSAQTQIYGLWRDQSGGLWCGGNCGSGQQCCTISPVNPMPAPGNG